MSEARMLLAFRCKWINARGQDMSTVVYAYDREEALAEVLYWAFRPSDISITECDPSIVEPTT